MSIRKPVFTAEGSIDCEIKVDGQWVPFTASADDAEDLGRRVFASAEALAPSPYVAPKPPAKPTKAEALAAERARMVCSKFQAKAALLAADLLADAETAVAASDVLTRLAWADAVEFRRNSPTIAALAEAMQLSGAQVDALFRAAMLIEA